MDSRVFCSSDQLPYCCGVRDIGSFMLAPSDQDVDDMLSDGYFPVGHEELRSGAGVYTATFVHTNKCNSAFEEMCEKYELLYRSPDFYNKNSGNNLFLCVFKDK